jgi:hypothetical protein
MTALTPATTSHRTTCDRVRAFFGYVPKGARYYLSTFDTAAIGSPPETTKYSLDRVIRELRAGAKDPSVTNVTVLIMYDGPTEGGGRTPDPEPPQLFLPLGTTNHTNSPP